MKQKSKKNRANLKVRTKKEITSILKFKIWPFNNIDFECIQDTQNNILC